MLYTYTRFKITDNLQVEIVYTNDTYTLIDFEFTILYKNIKTRHENLFLKKAMGDALYVI